jgi:hypothetical protein
MSSDAKVWKDEDGWHGTSDLHTEQIDATEYDLSYIIDEIEAMFKQNLNWEIFKFENGLGLRGYRAK